MAAVRKAAGPAWQLALKKWCYNRSYFREIGLMRDDCLEETPAVVEALRRLPESEYDKRTFRIIRALNLSNQKTVLPVNEWTQLEDDVQYLTPIVDMVEAEMLERSEWNSR